MFWVCNNYIFFCLKVTEAPVQTDLWKKEKLAYMTEMFIRKASCEVEELTFAICLVFCFQSERRSQTQGGSLWQLLLLVIQCPCPMDKRWYFFPIVSIKVLNLLWFDCIGRIPTWINPKDQWNMMVFGQITVYSFEKQLDWV